VPIGASCLPGDASERRRWEGASRWCNSASGTPFLGFCNGELSWCVSRSTLLVGKTGLEQAKQLIVDYKQGNIKDMTPELWKAKKIVDSTLHPGMECGLQDYGFAAGGLN
jgi:hypothetical protein